MKKRGSFFKLMLVAMLAVAALMLSGAHRPSGAAQESDALRVARQLVRDFSHSAGGEKWQQFAENEPLLFINLCVQNQ